METRLAVAIDIQGFVDEAGHLIPKEIMWSTLDSRLSMHAIISPPYEWDKLGASSQIVNDYLTKKKHGLNWGLTGIPYSNIQNFLNQIPKNITVIYLYHRNMYKLMNVLAHQKVIIVPETYPEMETFAIPGGLCHIHKDLAVYDKQRRCARTNVYRMIKGLRQQPTLTLDLPYRAPSPPIAINPEAARVAKYTYPGFARAETRLLSFFNWPCQILQPSMLVSKGFFYTGEGENVKCFSCGITMGFWLPDDDIDNRHNAFTDYCPFLMESANTTLTLLEAAGKE